MYHIALMEQCVDFDKLDGQFIRACCGQSEYISSIGGSCEGTDYKVRHDHSVLHSTINVLLVDR